MGRTRLCQIESRQGPCAAVSLKWCCPDTSTVQVRSQSFTTAWTRRAAPWAAKPNRKRRRRQTPGLFHRLEKGGDTTCGLFVGIARKELAL